MAVPSPWLVNRTPGGSSPVSVILGTGWPVVVTVNVNAASKAAAAAERLVKAGPCVMAAGVIAIEKGALPTGIGGSAVLVAVEIGVTVPELALTT